MEPLYNWCLHLLEAYGIVTSNIRVFYIAISPIRRVESPMVWSTLCSIELARRPAPDRQTSFRKSRHHQRRPSLLVSLDLLLYANDTAGKYLPLHHTRWTL